MYNKILKTLFYVHIYICAKYIKAKYNKELHNNKELKYTKQPNAPILL